MDDALAVPTLGDLTGAATAAPIAPPDATATAATAPPFQNARKLLDLAGAARARGDHAHADLLAKYAVQNATDEAADTGRALPDWLPGRVESRGEGAAESESELRDIGASKLGMLKASGYAPVAPAPARAPPTPAELAAMIAAPLPTAVNAQAPAPQAPAVGPAAPPAPAEVNPEAVALLAFQARQKGAYAARTGDTATADQMEDLGAKLGNQALIQSGRGTGFWGSAGAEAAHAPAAIASDLAGLPSAAARVAGADRLATALEPSVLPEGTYEEAEQARRAALAGGADVPRETLERAGLLGPDEAAPANLSEQAARPGAAETLGRFVGGTAPWLIAGSGLGTVMEGLGAVPETIADAEVLARGGKLVGAAATAERTEQALALVDRLGGAKAALPKLGILRSSLELGALGGAQGAGAAAEAPDATRGSVVSGAAEGAGAGALTGAAFSGLAHGAGAVGEGLAETAAAARDALPADMGARFSRALEELQAGRVAGAGQAIEDAPLTERAKAVAGRNIQAMRQGGVPALGPEELQAQAAQRAAGIPPTPRPEVPLGRIEAAVREAAEAKQWQEDHDRMAAVRAQIEPGTPELAGQSAVPPPPRPQVIRAVTPMRLREAETNATAQMYTLLRNAEDPDLSEAIRVRARARAEDFRKEAAAYGAQADALGPETRLSPLEQRLVGRAQETLKDPTIHSQIRDRALGTLAEIRQHVEARHAAAQAARAEAPPAPESVTAVHPDGSTSVDETLPPRPAPPTPTPEALAAREAAKQAKDAARQAHADQVAQDLENEPSMSADTKLYSRLYRAVAAAPAKVKDFGEFIGAKGNQAQWTKEELEHTGVLDWIAEAKADGHAPTRTEVLNHLAMRLPRLARTSLGRGEETEAVKRHNDLWEGYRDVSKDEWTENWIKEEQDRERDGELAGTRDDFEEALGQFEKDLPTLAKSEEDHERLADYAQQLERSVGYGRRLPEPPGGFDDNAIRGALEELWQKAETAQFAGESYEPHQTPREYREAAYDAFYAEHPHFDQVMQTHDDIENGEADGPQYEQYTLPGGQHYEEHLIRLTNPRRESYEQPHSFGEADTENTLVHYRTKDRTDTNGRKTRFIEEIQSDWGQAAREHGITPPSEAADPRQVTEARARLQGLENARADLGENYASPEFRRANRNVQLAGEGVEAARAGPQAYAAFQAYDRASQAYEDYWEQHIVPFEQAHGAVLNAKGEAYANSAYRTQAFFNDSPEGKALQEKIELSAEALREARHAAPYLALSHEAENAGHAMRALMPGSGTTVPPAPWLDTQAWQLKAMQHILHDAVHDGVDHVVWTTGTQQAERYNLRSHIDRIEYSPLPDGRFHVEAFRHSGDTEPMYNEDVDYQKLAGDVTGREVADRIKNGEGEPKVTRPAYSVSHDERMTFNDYGAYADAYQVMAEKMKTPDLQRHTEVLEATKLIESMYNTPPHGAADKVFQAFVERGILGAQHTDWNRPTINRIANIVRGAFGVPDQDYEAGAAEPNAPKVLRAEGLEMGGEGHRELYDKILPRTVEAYGKRLGVPITVRPSYEKAPEGYRFSEFPRTRDQDVGRFANLPQTPEALIERNAAAFAQYPEMTPEMRDALKGIPVRMRAGYSLEEAIIGSARFNGVPENQLIHALGGDAGPRTEQSLQPGQPGFEIPPALKELVRQGQPGHINPKLLGAIALGGAGGAAGLALTPGDLKRKMLGAGLGAVAGVGLTLGAGRFLRALDESGILRAPEGAPAPEQGPVPKVEESLPEETPPPLPRAGASPIGQVPREAKGTRYKPVVDEGADPRALNIAKFNLDPDGEKELRDRTQALIDGGMTKKKVTWEETTELAKTIGMDPTKLLRETGDWSGAQAKAARDILHDATERIVALGREVRNPLTSDEARQAAATEQAGLVERANQMIQRFTKERSQAGRDLNTYKMLAQSTMDPATWLSLAQRVKGGALAPDEYSAVVQLAREFNRDGLATYIHGLHTSTFLDKALTLWKAGLLSGPPTLMVKTTSDITSTLLENTKEPLAVAIDYMIALARYERGETGSVDAGRAKAYPIIPEVKAQFGALKTGWQQGKKILKDGAPQTGMAFWNFDQTRFENPLLQAYTQGVRRLLTAADAAALAPNLARTLGENTALYMKQIDKLTPGTPEWDAKWGEYRTNPPAPVVPRALLEAQYATFHQPNALAQWITSGARQAQRDGKPFQYAARTITMPFVTLPLNVTSNLIDYSPFGLFRTLADQVGDPSQKRLAEGIARSMTGSGLVWLGFHLASEGKATGSAPNDEAERTRWQEEGKGANEVLINGSWVHIGRLSPAGMLVSLGAQFYDVHRRAQAMMEPGVKRGAAEAAMGVASLGKVAVDQSFMKGIEGTLDAVNDPLRAGPQFLEQTAGSVVPNIVGRFARGLRKTQLQPEGPGQAILSELPGGDKAAAALGDTIPERMHPLGEPVAQPGETAPGRMARALFDPYNVTPDRTSPALREADRLGIAIPTPTGTRKNPATGEMVPRSTNDRHAEEKEQGPSLRAVLDQAVGLPEYGQLPDDLKKSFLQSALNQVQSETSARDKSQLAGRLPPRREAPAMIVADALDNLALRQVSGERKVIVDNLMTALVTKGVEQFKDVLAKAQTDPMTAPKPGEILSAMKAQAFDPALKRDALRKFVAGIAGRDEPAARAALEQAVHQGVPITSEDLVRAIQAKIAVNRLTHLPARPARPTAGALP